jgi:hypothetical protein
MPITIDTGCTTSTRNRTVFDSYIFGLMPWTLAS